MKCDNCDDGYRISEVTGKESMCIVCMGQGVLNCCDNFNPGNSIAVFRNSRCINCGVRKNDHIFIAEEV